MDDLLTPPFDTKIAVVVRDDLEVWQRLNVTAFLISGVTAAHPELVGEAYADAAGRSYLPLLGMPVLIFEGTPSAVATAHERAVRRGTPLAIYTKGMFATGHDAANREVVATSPADELDLVGLALHAPKNAVDRILKGTRLHP